MSGLTFNAYRETFPFQGSGIYSSANGFSLDSNTIILFAFVLASAYLLCHSYFFVARLLTKVMLRFKS